MAFNISDVKAHLPSGGTRPTLFQAQVTNPYGSSASDQKFFFTCEAASLPGMTIGSYEIPYFGRKVKYAGDRSYSDWTVTVINDDDFLVRKAFEDWIDAINDTETNLMSPQAMNSLYKQSQANVIQYGRDGNVVKTYNFEGIWPLGIGDITLQWSSANQYENFSVTFKYDQFTAS